MKNRLIRSLTAVVLAFGISGVFAMPATAAGETPNDSFDAQMLSLINAERAKSHLTPLQDISPLRPALVDHSTKMSLSNSLDHATNEQISADFAAVGCTAAGSENIATGYPTPQDAVAAYMKSAGHKANIMDPNARYFSSGTVRNSAGVNWNTTRFAQNCNVAQYSSNITVDSVMNGNRTFTFSGFLYAGDGPQNSTKNVTLTRPDGSTLSLTAHRGAVSNRYAFNHIDTQPVSGAYTFSYEGSAADTATSAQRSITVNTRISGFAADSITVPVNETYIIESHVVSPALGRDYVLQSSTDDGATWTTASALKAGGSYQEDAPLTLPAVHTPSRVLYRVHLPATSFAGEATSPVITVGYFVPPTEVSGWTGGTQEARFADTPLSFTLNIAPGANRSIELQKFNGSSWSTEVSTPSNVNASQPTVVTLPDYKAIGQEQWRVFIPANGFGEEWTSTPLTVNVVKAQTTVQGWEAPAEVTVGSKPGTREVTVLPADGGRTVKITKNGVDSSETYVTDASGKVSIPLDARSAAGSDVYGLTVLESANAESLATASEINVNVVRKDIIVSGWSSATKNIYVGESARHVSLTTNTGAAGTFTLQRFDGTKWTDVQSFPVTDNSADISFPTERNVAVGKYRIVFAQTPQWNSWVSEESNFNVAKRGTTVIPDSPATMNLDKTEAFEISYALTGVTNAATAQFQRQVNGEWVNVTSKNLSSGATNVSFTALAGSLGSESYRVILGETSATLGSVSPVVTVNRVPYPTNVFGWDEGVVSVDRINPAHSVDIEIYPSRGRVVELQKKVNGTWTTVESLNAPNSEMGEMSVTLPKEAAGSSSEYRLHVPAISRGEEFTSPVLTVKTYLHIRPAIEAGFVDSTLTVDEQAVINLSLENNDKGLVHLQLLTDGEWKTVSSQETSNSGNATFRFTKAIAGRFSYRVIADANENYTASTSPSLSFTSSLKTTAVNGWFADGETVTRFVDATDLAKAVSINRPTTIAGEPRSVILQERVDGVWTEVSSQSVEKNGSVTLLIADDSTPSVRTYRLHVAENRYAASWTSGSVTVQTVKHSVSVDSLTFPSSVNRYVEDAIEYYSVYSDQAHRFELQKFDGSTWNTVDSSEASSWSNQYPGQDVFGASTYRLYVAETATHNAWTSASSTVTVLKNATDVTGWAMPEHLYAYYGSPSRTMTFSIGGIEPSREVFLERRINGTWEVVAKEVGLSPEFNFVFSTAGTTDYRVRIAESDSYQEWTREFRVEVLKYNVILNGNFNAQYNNYPDSPTIATVVMPHSASPYPHSLELQVLNVNGEWEATGTQVNVNQVAVVELPSTLGTFKYRFYGAPTEAYNEFISPITTATVVKRETTVNGWNFNSVEDVKVGSTLDYDVNTNSVAGVKVQQLVNDVWTDLDSTKGSFSTATPGTFVYRAVVPDSAVFEGWESQTLTVNVTKRDREVSGWNLPSVINRFADDVAEDDTLAFSNSYKEDEHVTLQVLSGGVWTDVRDLGTTNDASIDIKLPASPRAGSQTYRVTVAESSAYHAWVSSTVTINTSLRETSITQWNNTPKTYYMDENSINIQVMVTGPDRTAILQKKSADGSWSDFKTTQTESGEAAFAVPVSELNMGMHGLRLFVPEAGAYGAQVTSEKPINVVQRPIEVSGWNLSTDQTLYVDNAPIAVTLTTDTTGATFTLQSRDNGAWADVRQVVGTSAHFSITPTTEESSKVYRVVVTKDARYAEWTSPEASVTTKKYDTNVNGWDFSTDVRRLVTDSDMPFTITAGEVRSIELQKDSGGGWITVASVNAEKMSASLEVTDIPSVVKYRVVVLENATHRGWVSPVARVTVTKETVEISGWEASQTLAVGDSATLEFAASHAGRLQQMRSGGWVDVLRLPAGFHRLSVPSPSTAGIVTYRFVVDETSDIAGFISAPMTIEFKAPVSNVGGGDNGVSKPAPPQRPNTNTNSSYVAPNQQFFSGRGNEVFNNQPRFSPQDDDRTRPMTPGLDVLPGGTEQPADRVPPALDDEKQEKNSESNEGNVNEALPQPVEDEDLQQPATGGSSWQWWALGGGLAALLGGGFWVIRYFMVQRP